MALSKPLCSLVLCLFPAPSPSSTLHGSSCHSCKGSLCARFNVELQKMTQAFSRDGPFKGLFEIPNILVSHFLWFLQLVELSHFPLQLFMKGDQQTVKSTSKILPLFPLFNYVKSHWDSKSLFQESTGQYNVRNNVGAFETRHGPAKGYTVEQMVNLQMGSVLSYSRSSPCFLAFYNSALTPSLLFSLSSPFLLCWVTNILEDEDGKNA